MSSSFPSLSFPSSSLKFPPFQYRLPRLSRNCNPYLHFSNPRPFNPNAKLSLQFKADDSPSKDPSTIKRPPVSRKCKFRSNGVSTITAHKMRLKSLRDVHASTSLTHGLDRVLFNPGIHHVQDPRSRIFNFDPFIQKIVPVQNFNFDLLPQYIPPHQDTFLNKLTKELGHKFFSSSSNITQVLAHFHYLLSQFRPITLDNLSRALRTDSDRFTKISQAPVSVILEWKDGTYALELEKDLDSPNIFSLLGHTLEQLFTNSPSTFDQFRKLDSTPHHVNSSSPHPQQHSSYAYNNFGNMVFRSQLDAYDPRLPGTGIFDIKTRAVVSLRLNSRDIDKGMGYEIIRTHGTWLSYERELYDMLRSILLKYSLQARLGNMDGIFVAYHNIERIFGFQYLGVEDIDEFLHGQSTRLLGDQELLLSLHILNEALEKITHRFPRQTLRLTFESRPTKVPFMYIFAEPVSLEEVQLIRNKANQLVRDYTNSLCKNVNYGEPSVRKTIHDNDVESKSVWEATKQVVDLEILQDGLKTDIADASLSEMMSRILVSAKASHKCADEIRRFLHEYDGNTRLQNAGRLKYIAIAKDKLVNLTNDLNTNFSEFLEQICDQPEQVKLVSDGFTRHIRLHLEEIQCLLDSLDPILSSADLVETSQFDNPLPLCPKSEPVKLHEPSLNHTSTIEKISSNLNHSDPSSHTQKGQICPDPEELSQVRDLFALVLTIKNKVNGIYVERPVQLDACSTWKVEYSFSEIIDPVIRAKNYDLLRARRSRLLLEAQNQQAHGWSKMDRDITRMVDKSKSWREQQDARDSEIGTIVYEALPRNPVT